MMISGRVCLLTILTVLMMSCRSKAPYTYVLNPIPCKSTQQIKHMSNLRIGLDKVKIPDYLDKSPMLAACSANSTKPFKNHEWGESLSNNITRVLRTNLSILLPGAVVESSPWSSQFQPNYHVQVMISEYKVNVQGNSVLWAEFLIYHDAQVVNKQRICLKIKLPVVNPVSVASSMNANLTTLSRTVAKYFQRGKFSAIK